MRLQCVLNNGETTWQDNLSESFIRILYTCTTY